MKEASWVLVVEPDPKAAEDWRACLSLEGVDVEMASSVKEAATKLKTLQCSCLVVAVDLPEMKGYEAVPILKAIQPRAKVIMTAKLNSKQLEGKVRGQDVFYYHIKSFGTSELVSAVNAALQADRKGKTTQKPKE